MNLFRNLRCDEIEVRRSYSSRRSDGKAELLLYKTARTDYNLLDETFGPFGWSCNFEERNGILFAGIGIKDPKTGTWVWKYNAGAESNIEKEKGLASDCLKRAGFAWSVGRELYSAPKIVITPGSDYETYRVDFIDYDENSRIKDLTIVNNRGAVVFNFREGKICKISDIDPTEVLEAVCADLKAEGEDYKELGKFYKYYREKIGAWDNVSTRTINNLWLKWKANAR